MRRSRVCITVCIVMAGLAIPPISRALYSVKELHAQTADQLQAEIQKRNSDIAALDALIKSYQKQIDNLGSQAQTLSQTIKSLELNRKQLEAKINITIDEIAAKNFEIQQLGKQIERKQSNIDDDTRIVRQTFKSLNEVGNTSIVEIVLSGNSLGSVMDSLDSIGTLQSNMYGRIRQLSNDKASLLTNEQATVKAKSDLEALRSQLSDQKTIVLQTTAEQNALLKATNQSEASYKQMLSNKQAEEQALQQEINQYESQLHLLVNPNQIPHTGAGILSWPLDSIRITQYFGNTPFSTANPQIYGGKGHDGVDFAAPIGTPVKAALSGIVVGVENTDLYPGCYSFGKWVMIKHANGLSTLYAHLSLQSVAVGQTVTTGQLIGYSGNTGYTTGPHLHFGVYATAGTVIKLFTNSLHCQGATIPIADFSAYLNPLSYL